MKVVSPIQVQKTKIPGIEHQTLAGEEEGLKGLSVWLQRIGPQGATPPHRHDCEEIIIVTNGSGEVLLNGSAHPFQAPCSLNIPKNAPHQIINTGDEPLETYAVFSMTPVEVYLPNDEKLDLPWRT